MGCKAVFLDRDGTINEEVGFLDQIEKFKLLPRAGEAIRLLNRNNFKTIVITNQSGVARGYFPESLVLKVHQKMKDLLKNEGAYLDGVHYCPHLPDGVGPPNSQSCNCRKPKTGLIDIVLKELNIDFSKSYSIGDRGSDIEFGRRIGAKTILVLTGYGKEESEHSEDQWKSKPDYVAQNLYEAVQWILHEEGG
ncbi:MAG: HAD family hydrolase [Deltaproteobacteria bacterium]|nr:HAD family hydrolase [Deltaproteobacteria bacterium]MBM4347338.1 HAD family hydrolase [Deltaproteobacteria bacterium]